MLTRQFLVYIFSKYFCIYLIFIHCDKIFVINVLLWSSSFSDYYLRKTQRQVIIIRIVQKLEKRKNTIKKTSPFFIICKTFFYKEFLSKYFILVFSLHNTPYLRQSLNELMAIGFYSCILYILFRSIWISVEYIFINSCREKHWLLSHYTYVTSQPTHIEIFDILPVN